MRIARFVADGGDPSYGIVELEQDGAGHPDTIAAISGDPLVGPVNYTGERVPLGEVRLVAPVIPRSKVVAIGKNYAAHAAEFNSSVPAEPLTFLKPNTSVIGPGEPIVYPPETENLHFEGELAVVIGRICRRVPRDRAAEVIFGYTVANDVTCRDLQARDKQWTRAKGYDTFCPLGPWIVTHLSLDEVGDLSIATTLNGVPQQSSRTSLMVRGVAELVEFVSSYTTLLPGDVILTGTPEGVGPMQPGDSVSVTIESIGTLTNLVVAEEN
ncbi:MAG: fumarylacetoacetate hydrolase family protein [Micropruina sp.]|nr:fumarylacetoacetate hydrolase family protein [Micropruina sp.]